MSKIEDVNVDAPKTKPLMYGDATYDVDRLDEMERVETNWDNSYIEGYSEAKTQNDIRMGKGLEPIKIPKLLWIRVPTVDGRDHMSHRDKWQKL